jgi:hypothetical protein
LRNSPTESAALNAPTAALLLDQFADELLQHDFDKLHLYVDNVSDSDLIAELVVNCSYATGAQCLRTDRAHQEYLRAVALDNERTNSEIAMISRTANEFDKFVQQYIQAAESGDVTDNYFYSAVCFGLS